MLTATILTTYFWLFRIIFGYNLGGFTILDYNSTVFCIYSWDGSKNKVFLSLPRACFTQYEPGDLPFPGAAIRNIDLINVLSEYQDYPDAKINLFDDMLMMESGTRHRFYDLNPLHHNGPNLNEILEFVEGRTGQIKVLSESVIELFEFALINDIEVLLSNDKDMIIFFVAADLYHLQWKELLEEDFSIPVVTPFRLNPSFVRVLFDIKDFWLVYDDGGGNPAFEVTEDGMSATYFNL